MTERVLPVFRGRVLAVDEAVALRCAALHVPDRRSDRDALIAATAIVHARSPSIRHRNTRPVAGERIEQHKRSADRMGWVRQGGEGLATTGPFPNMPNRRMCSDVHMQRMVTCPPARR
jgi:hypothetical protein